LGDQVFILGWLGNALSVLSIVWVLNLFNFMDGIDGLAASEAAYVTAAGAALWLLFGSDKSLPVASLCVAASSLGFLVWNWPPAKIFMGDVGSGYLGYAIAVLGLGAGRRDGAMLCAWVILGGVFFIDATTTLLLRLVRGRRIYEAHRSHAYQWLARRWGSHRRVTVAVLMVNSLWLLPCAMFAVSHPLHAAGATVVALAPLVIIAVASGSGRSEAPERVRS